MIWILAILSLIDIICTGLGMQYHLIAELNPLANWMFQWSIIGTCLFFALMNGIACAVLAYAKNRVKYARDLIMMVIGVKLMVIYLHGYWIIQQITSGKI